MGVYAEPFFGSGAVLLQSPRVSPREIVCDKNCMVVNFWRAMQNDPEQVAKWADYPSFHDDLTARHRWLMQWGLDNRDRVQTDPDFSDAKAAGWWAWGMSLWIGGGFAAIPFEKVDADPFNDGQIPFIRDNGNGGRGVSTHRKELKPKGDGQIPYSSKPGGQGVQVQRAQRIALPKGLIGDGQRLQEWFFQLAERLQNVFVLNRDWESAVTPTLLQQTKSGLKTDVAIFLDPPYRTDKGRQKVMYADEDESTRAAKGSYEWAVAHGDKYRIIYCHHAGDFPVPDGWQAKEQTFIHAREGAVDQILISPACLATEQGRLF